MWIFPDEITELDLNQLHELSQGLLVEAQAKVRARFFVLWCSHFLRQITWLKWTTEASKVKCSRRFDYGKDCGKAYSRPCYLTSISFTLDEQLQAYHQAHIRLFKPKRKERSLKCKHQLLHISVLTRWIATDVIMFSKTANITQSTGIDLWVDN